MSGGSLLLVGGTVLRADRDAAGDSQGGSAGGSAGGSVRFESDHTVDVVDGVITAVRPTLPGDLQREGALDVHGQVVMPGLVNCHSHSPMTIFRGAAEDVSVDAWFNERIWPMEVNLTPDDVELGARLAIAEMIRSGTTCFADHYFSTDRIAVAVDETGVRAVLGETYFSGTSHDADGDGLARGLDAALRLSGAAGGRITTALAPHAPYTVDDADLERTAAAAHEHGLLVHVHASEGLAQTRNSLERTGATPIGVLHRAGVLEARVLLAHGIGVVPEDLPMLAGARVAVATAPKGYLKHGTDTTPVRLLRSAGVTVGLATDGAASNNTLDAWESMLFLALVQKAVERDPAFLTAAQVLHHATVQSAEAVGLGGVIGRVEPGYRADLLVVDLSAPRVQPVHDLAATLVHSARSDDVVHTVVEGRLLMRDRRLLTVDVAAVVAELTPRLARLTDRGHGRRIADYTA